MRRVALALYCGVVLPGCISLLHQVELAADKVGSEASSASKKPPELSPSAWEQLRYWDLDAKYLDDPQATLAEASQIFREHPDRDWAYALSELSFLAGKKSEEESHSAHGEHYVNSICYAYYFLFSGSEPLNAFDRRNAAACNLYNAGLERCLAAALKNGELAPSGNFSLKASGGKLTASAVRHGFTWRPEEFNELYLASDYADPDQVHAQRVSGLGVPLLGVRHQRNDGTEKHEQLLAQRHPFAVTAFFRPNLRRLTPHADLHALPSGGRSVPNELAAMDSRSRVRHPGALQSVADE